MIAKTVGRGPSVISLFTGAGGLDYGLEMAGFVTRVALDLDPVACQTLSANRSWPVIQSEIESVPTRAILRTAGLRKGSADLLVGGPPCQPFSKAGYWARGKARGLRDDRSKTLTEFIRVVAESRPRAFLLENVAGFDQGPGSGGLAWLMRQIRALNRAEGTRYRISWTQLQAADFGVPQKRVRLFVVGSRDGREFEFPGATHFEDGAGLDGYRTAWDALADVGPGEDEQLDLTGYWADLVPSLPEGENYLWHTDRRGGRPLFGWRTRYWSFLLKLAKWRPSWTIPAQPGPATGPFHWDNRRLGMRELCRLQTIPDDVMVEGGILDVQRQIGNAVPSLLGEVLGREIMKRLLDREPELSAPVLLPESRGAPPRATRRRPVPRKYFKHDGEHSAHPGTGRGPGARQRQTRKSSSP